MKTILRYIGKSVISHLPLFTFALLLLSLPAGYGFSGDNRRFAPVLFLTAAVCSVPFAALPCCIMRGSARWLAHAITGLYMLLFVVDTFLYLAFSTRMDSFIMLLMMQTNGQEASSFFNTFVLSRNTLAGVLALLVMSAAVWCFQREYIGGGGDIESKPLVCPHRPDSTCCYHIRHMLDGIYSLHTA